MSASHEQGERAIIGALLVFGQNAMAAVGDLLRPEDFHFSNCRAVFDAALRLWERRQEIDIVGVEAELRVANELRLAGGLEGLNRFQDDYGHMADLRSHAQRLQALAQVRRLASACREIADGASSALSDPEEWLDEVEGRFLASSDRGAGETAYTGSAMAKIFQEGLLARLAGAPLRCVSTGFADLDEKLRGGLFPGNLVVIGARPSMGKTALVMNILANAAILRLRDTVRAPHERPLLQPAMFFSLEMEIEQLTQRLHAIESGVDLGHIDNPLNRHKEKVLTTREMQALWNVGTRLDESPLIFDDAGGISMAMIRARARRWRADPRVFPKDAHEKHRIGVIAVDYLQLVRSKARAVREQEVAELSREAKALAKELRLPVIILAQLNRAVDARDDHRPTLADLRESGAIEQDADVVMFPYRPAYYLPKDAPLEMRTELEHTAEIIVAKARNGKIGTIPAFWQGNTQQFKDAANDRL